MPQKITPVLPQTVAELRAQIAGEIREQKGLLRKFESALIVSDIDELAELCPKIDVAFIWPRAWRRVLRIEQELSIQVKRFFLEVWVRHGDHLRQEAYGDLLLTRALRRLLPPYRGRDRTLFRGELFNNRARRTYGLAWSSHREVAVAYAEDRMRRNASGGTVLIRAEVPAAAIITKIPRGHDRYGENEFLVDRTGLKSSTVQVVKKYAHIDWNIRSGRELPVPVAEPGAA